MGAPLTVLYDLDCGFCRWTVALVLRLDRAGRLRPVGIQSPEGERLLGGMMREERLAAAHVVTPDGRVLSGGAAAPAIAGALPGGAPLAAALRRLSGPVDRAYRWVADHRTGLSRLVPERSKRRAAERIARHAARFRPGR